MPQKKPQQRKMSLFKKIAAGTVLTTAALGAAFGLARGMKHEVSGNCARYVRIEAKKFNKGYIGADAWNFANANKLVKRNLKGLKISEIKQTVKPGDAIGFWYKNSNYNQPGRVYTHLGIVVKVNPLVIQHNFRNERVMTEDMLNKRIGQGLLKPIDIIVPNSLEKKETKSRFFRERRAQKRIPLPKQTKEYALPRREEDIVPNPVKQKPNERRKR